VFNYHYRLFSIILTETTTVVNLAKNIIYWKWKKTIIIYHLPNFSKTITQMLLLKLLLK